MSKNLKQIVTYKPYIYSNIQKKWTHKSVLIYICARTPKQLYNIYMDSINTCSIVFCFMCTRKSKTYMRKKVIYGRNGLNAFWYTCTPSFGKLEEAKTTFKPIVQAKREEEKKFNARLANKNPK